MMTKNKKPLDQWMGINQELKLYKISLMFLAFIVALLSVGILLTMNPAPIVIEASDSERHYHIGSRDSKAPRKSDVKSFLKNFIRLRYSVFGSDFKTSVKNIEPYSTDGYMKAVKKELQEVTKNKDQIKDFAQYVSNLQIEVTDKEAQATFDKIVRINGVPIVVPTEASFEIVKSKHTAWNPYGILVNGVIEHENK